MASGAQERVLLDPKPIFRVLAVLAILGMVYLARHLVFLVLFTMVFAAAINPLVTWLSHRGLPRALSILLTFIGLFAIIGTAFYFAGDLMFEQARAFVQSVPSYLDSAVAFLGKYFYIPGQTEVINLLQGQLQKFSSQLFSFLMSAVDYAMLLISAIVGMVVMLAMTFYLLSDVEYFKGVVVDAMPTRHQAQAQRILEQGASRIGDYIRGMLIVMSADGIMAWIGLSLIGVPYAFLLGVMTFILTIVPLIGSTSAGILITVIALGYKPIMGLWALLLYLGIQLVESYLLTPVVLGRSVQLNPLWVILSVLVGGSLFGFWGVLLAVPGAVIFKLLVHELYINKREAQEPPFLN